MPPAYRTVDARGLAGLRRFARKALLRRLPSLAYVPRLVRGILTFFMRTLFFK